MLEQVQGVPRVLTCLCLSGFFLMTLVMGGISHAGSQHLITLFTCRQLKPLSTMQETWVQSLGWEDPLEKEMAIHSSIIIA